MSTNGDATEKLHNLRLPRSALVLYGSETGNSQDAAEEFSRTLERLRFSSSALQMNDIDLTYKLPDIDVNCKQKDLVQFDVIVFFVSTTGQGDFPANSRRFWKSLLRKRLPPSLLSAVSFTTFGFGDTSYPKYNWAARKLHKRLLQLGAKEIYERGEADEQNAEGSDAALLPWTLDFRKRLPEKFPLPAGLLPFGDDYNLPPKWRLVLAKDHLEVLQTQNLLDIQRRLTSGSEMEYGDELASCEQVKDFLPDHEDAPVPSIFPLDSAIPELSILTLKSNKRITPENHWQDVRHLVFSTSFEDDYGPGDILTIYPKNFEEDVSSLISLMEWNEIADEPLLAQKMRPHNVSKFNFMTDANICCRPDQITLRYLLTNSFDITAVPRRSFLQAILPFASNITQKERLVEFTNPAFTDEFYDYTSRPRRSILEVLQEFTSVKIPWDIAPLVFPALHGRQFSIASAGMLKQHNDFTEQLNVELLVAIVKYRTVIKKLRQGVCSRYLAQLPVGTSINVRFARGGLMLDKEIATSSILMIAPGTGIAPMRSLIWERATLSPAELSPSLLIYGGRNSQADFFFEDEWKSLRRTKLNVLTAFSRDQRQKIYVQDVIRANASKVRPYLENGYVYICGSSSKMPVEVRNAFIDVLVENEDEHRVRSVLERGVLSAEEAMEIANRTKLAEEHLEFMTSEGRLMQETW